MENNNNNGKPADAFTNFFDVVEGNQQDINQSNQQQQNTQQNNQTQNTQQNTQQNNQTTTQQNTQQNVNTQQNNTAVNDNNGNAASNDDPFFIPGANDNNNSAPVFDYKKFAKDNLLIMDETEEINEQILSQKIQELRAATKTEIDFEKYPPEVKLLVEHFNQNGSIAEFYMNPTIRQIDSWTSMDKKDQLFDIKRNMLANEGKADEMAMKSLETEISLMTDDEIAAELNPYLQRVEKLRTQEFEKVIAQKNEYNKKANELKQQQTIREREMLAKEVEKIKEYEGLAIPQNVIEFTKKQIVSGEFEKRLSQLSAEAKVKLYYEMIFGPQIAAYKAKHSQDTSRKSYNDGLSRGMNVAQNLQATSKSGSHTPRTRDGKLDFSQDFM